MSTLISPLPLVIISCALSVLISSHILSSFTFSSKNQSQNMNYNPLLLLLSPLKSYQEKMTDYEIMQKLYAQTLIEKRRGLFADSLLFVCVILLFSYGIAYMESDDKKLKRSGLQEKIKKLFLLIFTLKALITLEPSSSTFDAIHRPFFLLIFVNTFLSVSTIFTNTLLIKDIFIGNGEESYCEYNITNILFVESVPFAFTVAFFHFSKEYCGVFNFLFYHYKIFPVLSLALQAFMSLFLRTLTKETE